MTEFQPNIEQKSFSQRLKEDSQNKTSTAESFIKRNYKKVATSIVGLVTASSLMTGAPEVNKNQNFDPNLSKPGKNISEQITTPIPLTQEEKQKMEAELKAYEKLPADKRFSQEYFSKEQQIRASLNRDNITKSFEEARNNPNSKIIAKK